MGVTNAAQYQVRIPVVTAAEIVPPYAVVRLVSSTTDESTGETIWTVAAPDADGDPHVYILGNKTLTNASGDRGDATFWPLGRVAYDPADGEPAINEEWGPRAGSFLLRKDEVGFFCAGEADGSTAVFARIPGVADDDYPYPYGSYDSGGGGSSVQHDAELNAGCDEASGNVLNDRVQYTTVCLILRGRIYLSISMEVIEENRLVLAIECTSVLDNVTVSSAACVDGNIEIDLAKSYKLIRTPACGGCTEE